MKRWLPILALAFSVATVTAQVGTPDDQYVSIYQLIQQGDGFKESGQPKAALEKYLEAQRDLKRLQAANPAWNDKVVKFRLNYLAERITPLAAQFPGTSIGTRKSEPEAKPELPGTDSQINQLNNELARVRAEKALTDAKLREALAALPRTSDPREMSRAEAKISALEKERDLQKVSLDQERKNAAQHAEALAALTKERDALLAKVEDKSEKNELKAARSENDALKGQVAELTRRAAGLARLEEISNDLKQSRAENEKLRVLLTDAEKKTSTIPKLNEVTAELKQTQAEVKVLLAKNEALQKDSRKLEQLLTEPVKPPVPVVTPDNGRVAALEKEKADLLKVKATLEKENATLDKRSNEIASRVKSVERERDELEKKLATASKELADRKKGPSTVKNTRGPDEAALLRAKLEAYEAKRVPYTLEEQALFKKTEIKPILVADASSKVLPAGTASLIAEAQRAFAARRYDEAEKKYLQVLSLDEKNVFTLANLAAIQLEQGRMDVAEANVKKAIELAPDDSYSLSLLGLLKFRQNKLDESVEALSRAAQLDPKNAETQNYLGLALSQKGQRGPAEAAFRKAIQLSPGYAGAHHNLAVHYATQQPPTVELARWHYQKALSAGHPKNAELEKMLNQK